MRGTRTPSLIRRVTARWKAPTGRRVRQSAFLSRSAPGAAGFPRKTWLQSAGALRALLGTPGTRGPGAGVGQRFGAASYWAPGPRSSPQLARAWRRERNG